MKSDPREELRICWTLSGFNILNDREQGNTCIAIPQIAKAGITFLVRSVVIANDQMEEDKGRDGLR